jgi:dTDP-4-dehydrorhamnose 3,5-epimerase-like enzyme
MPGSKTDQIIAMVKGSGTRGLKVGEILSGATAMGLDVQPSSLRGLVWAQKQAGRFVAVDDRYYTPENVPRGGSHSPQATEPSSDAPQGEH